MQPRSPFGAVLQLNPACVSRVESNKPFKANLIAGVAFHGQYVVPNDMNIATPKFDAAGSANVKTSKRAETSALLSQGAVSHEAPAEAIKKPIAKSRTMARAKGTPM